MSKFNVTVKGCTGNIVVGDKADLKIGASPGEAPAVAQHRRVLPEEVPATGASALVHCQESAGDGMKYTAKSGYVLVINNYFFPSRSDFERTGSIDDVSKLSNLFDDFGFRTRVCDNLTKSEMLNILKDTAEKDFSRYDCFVCVILSHGSSKGIYGTDEEVIKPDAITSLFRRDECPSLEGKPKIFLIQACRGNQRDQLPIESDSDPIMFSNPSLPADADFLICYASSPGHESYRQVSLGSWFISAVFQVFKEYADREHVMDMMLRVNNQVAGYFSVEGLKQIPCQKLVAASSIKAIPGKEMDNSLHVLIE